MLRLARACALDPRAANNVFTALAEPAVQLERQARSRMDGRSITDPDDPVWAACHRTITDALLAAGWTYVGDTRTEASCLPADTPDELAAARRLVADMVRDRLERLVLDTDFHARLAALRR
ncbi:hypothetical protein WME99_44745 [Sorangium sp. So ce136]|uniref:hypothetical protein n=1 Tax=Sorangium sp. So ce136 TaxID=3133284 RepID=UPI003F0093FA